MKICVIGAGFGGLAASTLVSAAGHETHVFEKESIVGGRGLTFNMDMDVSGYKSLLKRFHMWIPFAEPSIEDIFGDLIKGYLIDLGFHLMGGGKKAAPARVLSSQGIDLDFVGSRLGYIGDKVLYPFLSAMDKIKIVPRIFQLLFSRKSTISSLKDVSMAQTIQKYGTGKLALTLELFPRLITTVNDLTRISTGDTFFAQRELMGSSPVSYPVGGVGSIGKQLAWCTTQNGGVIHHKRVDHVIVENGVARGIQVEGKEEYFDVIVSNLPVQNFFSLVSPEYFPGVMDLRDLQGTGSLCAYYALTDIPRNLLGKSFMFIERSLDVDGNDAAGIIDFKMACPQVGTSPPGKFLVQSYIICSPNEAKSKKKMELLRPILDKYLNRLVPNYQKYMEWCLYPSVWQLDGVAKTIDMHKPACITPIQNLYFVGDCVESAGVGINCAVDSAIRFVNLLNVSHNIKH
jgi:protoporphyrinogen oxidase